MNFAELKGLIIPEGVVKKIEVDGVLLWVLETKNGLVYLGKAPALPTAAVGLGSGWNANLVVFSGGSKDGDKDTVINTVTSYDTNLTKSTLAALEVAVQNQWGGTCGDYACVGAGEDAASKFGNELHAYDLNGVQTISSFVSTGKDTGITFNHKGALCIQPNNASYVSGDGWSMNAYYRNIYRYDTELSRDIMLSSIFETVLGIKQSGDARDVVTGYAINSVGDYIVTLGGNLYTYAEFEKTSLYNAYCFDEEETLINTLPISNAQKSSNYRSVGFDDGALFFTYNGATISYFIDNNLVQTELSTNVSFVHGEQIVKCVDKGVFLGDAYINGVYTEYVPILIDKNGIISIGDVYTDHATREDTVTIGVLGDKVFVAGGGESSPTNIVDVLELPAE